MFLALAIVTFCLVLAVILTRRYRYSDPQWQLASGIGEPTVLLLAPVKSGVTDLSQLQNNAVTVYYGDTELAEYVVADVLKYYGIRSSSTRNPREAQLLVFLTDTRDGTPFIEELRQLTMRRDHPLTYVSMLAVNGGSTFIRDSEKPFYQAHSHYSKASIDAHGALQDYPHLVVPPLMYSYPTVRARLNLVVRPTNRITVDQLTTVRDMIDQANLERPLFHLDDLAVASTV